uniref:Probable serine/threonine-protein kinase DDB_G0282963 n=1 Tax=Dermatophagoides pteronyssinus TaxID=6956 RepID=A0A6P6XPY6_DERPT|nr:probable serine/threonine-protein kinase DDB_G0282963 [Dermatophagoides pteronyssinus]
MISCQQSDYISRHHPHYSISVPNSFASSSSGNVQYNHHHHHHHHSAPSTLVMTPISSPVYDDSTTTNNTGTNGGLSAAIMMTAASENQASHLMSSSAWLQTITRNNSHHHPHHHHHHHPHQNSHNVTYSDMSTANDWSNVATIATPNANSFQSATANTPLSYHPMASYSNQIGQVYPHNPYCTSNATSSGGSFPPLSVGTEESPSASIYPTTTFGHMNSSPDSGVTVSSDSNESSLLLNSTAPNNNDLSIGFIKSGSDTTSSYLYSNTTNSANNTNTVMNGYPTTINVIDEQNNDIQTQNNHHHNSKTTYEWMNKSANSNSSQSSTGKTRTKDKYRVVYTENQRIELEKEFMFSRYITIKRKAELANELSLSERQVKIWFQNRRAKDRKQLRKKDEITKKNKDKTTRKNLTSTGILDSGSIMMNNNNNNNNNQTTVINGNRYSSSSSSINDIGGGGNASFQIHLLSVFN